MGLNYREHLAETGMSPQAFPDLFNKYNTALKRHNGTIAVSTLNANEFDYESEQVVLIGREAQNVSEADALSYVFGYTAGNDFSARDLQLRTSQWLVTGDQIDDPQTLRIQTFVNDESALRQDANTSQMIFSVAQIISYTSQFITLEPGDVIFTGTPSGVILGLPKDKQIWLKAGDRIMTRISKLGDLCVTLA
jgi:2-keto-4-pentenoate hydratase/2-oxohepta-3-ene-1,7-dioic acid hydratase in catechol pathway